MRQFLDGPLSVIIAGMTLAIVAYLGYSNLNESLYLQAPIEKIFKAEVLIPDFETGSDPQVQYYRTISETFTGAFNVEIKEADTGKTVCTGNGRNILYEKNEILPDDTSLTWYVGANCPKLLSPGQYYLDTNYTISEEGMPDRFYSTKSNIFEVRAPAGQ